MDWWYWPILVGMICLVRLFQVRESAVLGEVQRISYRWRLPLTWTAHADAVRRTRSISRGNVIGAVVGSGLGLLVDQLTGSDAYPYGAVVGLWFGMTLGTAVAAARQVPSAPPGPRVSHARALSVDDFAPRWLTIATWAAPALAVGVVVAASLLREDPWSARSSLAGAVVLVAAAVVGAAGFRFVSTRAVRAPRVARTDLELAWQDGFVARSVVEASAVTTVASLGAVVLALFPSTAASGVPLLIGVAALALVALWPRPQQTFRRRLWNDRVFELTTEDLEAAPGRS